MSKNKNSQQRLDEIKAKNATRARKFKARKEAEGLVRVSLWIPLKLKQHIDKKGYQYIMGYADVETENIPCFINGKWQVNPKCV